MYCRMLQREHSAILSDFIKLPVYTIKEPYVLSIFECPFNTGVTVVVMLDTATNAAPSLHVPVVSSFLFRYFESKI